MIGETEGDPDVERRLIEEMLDRQVDGILYATLATSEVDGAPAAGRPPGGDAQLPRPDGHGPGRASPTSSRAAGRRQALLIAAGRERRVRVVGEDTDPRAIAGPLRLAGSAASGWPRSASSSRAWCRAPGRRTGVRRGERGARSAVSRSSALVCLNDRIAMGAYQALAERGLRVPDDVAVVSFDGSDLAGWLRPVRDLGGPARSPSWARSRSTPSCGATTTASSGSRCRWCVAVDGRGGRHR